MDTQDIINIGRKAKSETESFINRYINDGTKGWPKLCLCGSPCPGSHHERQHRKRRYYTNCLQS